MTLKTIPAEYIYQCNVCGQSRQQDKNTMPMGWSALYPIDKVAQPQEEYILYGRLCFHICERCKRNIHSLFSYPDSGKDWDTRLGPFQNDPQD